MRFAIYDQNGTITRTGFCSDEDFEHQAREGERIIKIDETVTELTHKVFRRKAVLLAEPINPAVVVDPWEEIRRLRNSMLAACDWTQLADAPVDREAWAAYRQALRDVTKDLVDPTMVIWPIEPT